ncbi:MAG: hypothetical protein WBF33_10835 [Candidatus Nitrosopolaris sp.]|jgi:hypothetical protein
MIEISELLIIIGTVIGILLLIAGSVGIVIGSVLGIVIIALIVLYLQNIFYIYRTSSISKSRKSDIASGRIGRT